MSSIKDLYVFLDESGNYDFSTNGSSFFIVSAVVTDDPVQGAQDLLKLRHKILETDPTATRLKNLRDCTHFHCTEDSQQIRDAVFAIIAQLSFVACCVVLQKNKANPAIRSQEKIYTLAFGGLIKGIVKRIGVSRTMRIFAADFNLKSKKADFLSGLKRALAAERDLKYQICFHPSKTHHMLQVADYVCWAIARKWEQTDLRSFDLIKENVEYEFDLFRHGTDQYY